MNAGSDASAPVFRFAHLSDPHLTDLSDVRLRQIASKRVLGYLSWRRRRRAEHRPEILQRLHDDLIAQHPDHILVTGDLTHIALPEEFRQARRWLEGVGGPSHVTVVPGNHDQYVATRWPQGLGLWQEYMVSDTAGTDGARQDDFPSLRIRGPVAFIGLNTAVPSAPFLATGRLGERQLRRLAELLDALRDRDLVRVLMLHHPPVPGEEKWRKRLTDAPALRATLARFPVDVILHGHCHRAMRTTLRLHDRGVPVFGIASASAVGAHTGYASEYNLFEVSGGGASRRLRVTARRLSAASGAFDSEDLGTITLAR